MEVRAIIKRTLVTLGVLIVVGYSYYALRDFIHGPRIVIASPENGFATTSPFISITGTAIRSSNLAINGNPTPLDLEGHFERRLILAPGYNIMTITAQDRYNRTVEERLEINLLPKTATSTNN